MFLESSFCKDQALGHTGNIYLMRERACKSYLPIRARLRRLNLAGSGEVPEHTR